jgi:ribosomal protein L17
LKESYKLYMKDKIKQILKEEFYQETYTPDKWDLLEHDLRRYVEKLITDHRQNFHNDQYEVISAIEEIMEGMFARVPR